MPRYIATRSYTLVNYTDITETFEYEAENNEEAWDIAYQHDDYDDGEWFRVRSEEWNERDDSRFDVVCLGSDDDARGKPEDFGLTQEELEWAKSAPEASSD